MSWCRRARRRRSGSGRAPPAGRRCGRCRGCKPPTPRSGARQPAGTRGSGGGSAEATVAGVDFVGAAALRKNPAATAILTDFDGTLSAIVANPQDAQPLPGAVEVLSDLSILYGRVAVISGRPVAYLVDRLGA